MQASRVEGESKSVNWFHLGEGQDAAERDLGRLGLRLGLLRLRVVLLAGRTSNNPEGVNAMRTQVAGAARTGRRWQVSACTGKTDDATEPKEATRSIVGCKQGHSRKDGQEAE